jgi:hypothetical protein
MRQIHTVEVSQRKLRPRRKKGQFCCFADKNIKRNLIPRTSKAPMFSSTARAQLSQGASGCKSYTKMYEKLYIKVFKR